MPEASPTHPAAQDLADFAAGNLTRERAAALAQHVRACAECRRKLEAFAAPARAAGASGTLPAFAAEAPLEAAPPLVTVAEAPPPELASSSKYEVLGKLGDGGMGSVWKVRHTLLNRVVAVKVMRPDASAHE